MSIGDPIKQGRRNRRKGARGELDVVAILRAHGWRNARRNLGRDIKRSQAGRDIVDGPAGTWISVKRSERLKLREAYAECSAHCGYDIPIVVHRCNNQPWLASLPLEDLLPLLALRERG